MANLSPWMEQKVKASKNKKMNFNRKKLAEWLYHVDERVEEYLAAAMVADCAEV